MGLEKNEGIQEIVLCPRKFIRKQASFQRFDYKEGAYG
jgi:hypothetical protein